MLVETLNNSFEIENKKIQLISLITNVQSLNILEKIEKFLNSTEDDWWTLLSKDEQNGIDEGLEDLKKGNIISHQSVRCLKD